MSLLPKILWISYLIGVYMEHPSLYYVLYTYHRRRCNSDMIIPMLPTTETLHLNGTAVYDESKMQIRYCYQIRKKKSKEFTLVYSYLSLFIFCDRVRYFVDMAISGFDLGNSWPVSQARSVAKVMYETSQTIYSHCFRFVWIGPCILKTYLSFDLAISWSRSLPNSKKICPLI